MACLQCGNNAVGDAKFCAECGAAQGGSCPACEHRNPSTARFCQECGRRLKAGRTRVAGPTSERLEMTVMFTDLADSTRISSGIDPEDFGDVIAGYIGIVEGIITKFGGHVGNYLGDGVLAYFGYSRVSEDDAERACIAGLEIVKAVADAETQVAGQSLQLAARCGIHTGTVLVGTVGSDSESMAVGESINLAARLVGIADVGAVVMSRATQRIVGSRFETETLGTQELKGISTPVECFRVRRRHRAGEVAAQSLRPTAPLIGRGSELELLTSRWRRTVEGHGQFVTISGEAGLGKGRLIAAFRSTVEDADWLQVRGAEYTAETAFTVATGLLEQLLDVTPGGPLADLESALLQIDIPLQPAVPLLASLLGVEAPADRYPAILVTPQVVRAMTLASLVDTFIAASRQKPLVVAIEGTQWMDSTSFDFVESLAERVHGSSILLILAGRAIHQGDWTPDSTIYLTHLPTDHARSLVRGIDTEARLDNSMIEQIVDKGDGNPLYLEEITIMLLQQDSLSGDAISRVPPTLNELLLARLDRIGHGRVIIQHAAAIGRTFSRSLLEEVSGVRPGELAIELDQRVAVGQLRERGKGSGTGYSFRHGLLLDAAERSMTRTMRTEVNSKIADAMLVVEEPNAAVVARHLALAGRSLEAVRFWTIAGGTALGSFALVESLGALENGLALLAGNDSEDAVTAEIRLRTTYGVPLMLTQGFASEAMADNYRALLAACERAGQDAVELVFPALWGLWTYHEVGGRLASAEEMGQRLLDLAASTGNSGIQLAGHCAFGAARFLQGDVATARAHFYAGLDVYDIDQHAELGLMFGQDGGAMCAAFLTWVHAHDGDLEAAQVMADRALDMCATLDQLATWGFVEAVLASYYCVIERYEEAIPHARRVIELGETQGMPHWEAQGRCTLGWALGVTDSPGDGIELIMTGLKGFEMTGTRAAMTYFSAGLTQAHLNLGEITLAEETLDAMDSFMAETGEVFFKPHLLRLRARLLMTRGQADDAIALLRDAVATAVGQGAVGLAAAAQVDLDALAD